MAGAEGTVQFEVVGMLQESAADGKQDILRVDEREKKSMRTMLLLLLLLLFDPTWSTTTLP